MFMADWMRSDRDAELRRLRDSEHALRKEIEYLREAHASLERQVRHSERRVQEERQRREQAEQYLRKHSRALGRDDQGRTSWNPQQSDETSQHSVMSSHRKSQRHNHRNHGAYMPDRGNESLKQNNPKQGNEWLSVRREPPTRHSYNRNDRRREHGTRREHGYNKRDNHSTRHGKDLKHLLAEKMTKNALPDPRRRLTNQPSNVNSLSARRHDSKRKQRYAYDSEDEYTFNKRPNNVTYSRTPAFAHTMQALAQQNRRWHFPDKCRR